jgi:uncharacterized protein (TIGR03437 family)
VKTPTLGSNQNKADRLDGILAGVGIFLICIYFLLLARPALEVFFTPDDCMNLYSSWSFPTARLVKANLLFFLAFPLQRPLGSVFYAAIYHFVGFHALWFHIIALVVLTANILLTYFLARRLSGSRFAALLAAFLACYQAECRSLYFNTGYIYDVLCYFFTLAALLTYIRVRQQGRTPNPSETMAIVALFIFALNSKEMAVMLPLFLLGYEVLYHPPKSYSPRFILDWVLGRRLPLSLCLVSVVFAVGRSRGPESLISNAAYRPHFTWDQFMLTSRGFLDALFVTSGAFTTALVLAIWALTAAVALFSRSRALAFAWLFAMTSVLPIAFLLPRGPAQYYIPLFGWSLYGGVLIAITAKRAMQLFPLQVPLWGERLGAAAAFAALLFPCFMAYRALGMTGIHPVTAEAPMVQSIADQLHRLYPALPHGSRILFLDDPYPPNWENMIFVVRLSYRDDTLTVERLKQMNQPPTPSQLGSYSTIVNYRAGRFSVGNEKYVQGDRPPSIFIAGTANGLLLADAYHAEDWAPVTATNRANPGERIILKAMDLGATDPANEFGQPFPQSPFAHVTAVVNARVNTRPAAVEDKLGWPGEADVYRIDIRLPAKTEPGLAKLDISENGVISQTAGVWVQQREPAPAKPR